MKFKLLDYLHEAKANDKGNSPGSKKDQENTPQKYTPMGIEDQPPADYQGIQQDPNMMMQDPNMMGGMGQTDQFGMPIEPPLSPEEIGKVYMLLKIHSRLEAISRVLDDLSDEKYDDIKYSVGEALDLFKTIVLNYDSFKETPEKIDMIVTKYKDFMKMIANRLNNLGDTK